MINSAKLSSGLRLIVLLAVFTAEAGCRRAEVQRGNDEALGKLHRVAGIGADAGIRAAISLDASMDDRGVVTVCWMEQRGTARGLWWTEIRNADSEKPRASTPELIDQGALASPHLVTQGSRTWLGYLKDGVIRLYEHNRPDDARLPLVVSSNSELLLSMTVRAIEGGLEFAALGLPTFRQVAERAPWLFLYRTTIAGTDRVGFGPLPVATPTELPDPAFLTNAHGVRVLCALPGIILDTLATVPTLRVQAQNLTRFVLTGDRSILNGPRSIPAMDLNTSGFSAGSDVMSLRLSPTSPPIVLCEGTAVNVGVFEDTLVDNVAAFPALIPDTGVPGSSTAIAAISRTTAVLFWIDAADPPLVDPQSNLSFLKLLLNGRPSSGQVFGTLVRAVPTAGQAGLKYFRVAQPSLRATCVATCVRANSCLVLYTVPVASGFSTNSAIWPGVFVQRFDTNRWPLR